MARTNHSQSVGRNDPCPCGSGKKYKQCCMNRPGVAGAGPGAPGAPDPSRALARAREHHRAGRADLAAPLYQQVLQLDADCVPALTGLAEILGGAGRYDQAVACMRRAVKRQPRAASHHALLASLLRFAEQYGDAERHARAALELDRRNVTALETLAFCLARGNQPDAALRAAREALRLDPAHAQSRLLLATLLRNAGDAPGALTELQHLRGQPGLHSADRLELEHELGMVLDRLGRYDEAYDAFAAYAQLAAATTMARRVDRERWPRLIQAYRRELTADSMARWRDAPCLAAHRAPAFLMGFSRSGTTLTELVLAAHPDIGTSNEKPLITEVKRRLATMGGAGWTIPQALAALGPDDVAALRALFWERARHHCGPDAERPIFVHKQPMNTVDVGLITTLFPDARIVFTLRDPRDVCLSCFQQMFVINGVNIHFLTLASTVALYAQVMDLWLHLRDRLAAKWIEVKYEDTVEDLEREARTLLSHLGADWREDVLAFHTRAAARHIATPSYAAVARPVSRSAVGRWRGYERWFAPLLPQLQRFIDAFGYDVS